MEDPIIILGPGRCGSTLLQRILNTSRDITIWGEHGGFLKGIADSYWTLINNQGLNRCYYSKNIDPSIVIGSLSRFDIGIEWVNSFDKQVVADEHRNLIIGLLNHGLDINRVRWGFKEIRYTNQDKTINMLLQLFPSSFFIFSIRDPFSNIKSMLLTWHQDILQTHNHELIANQILKTAKRWNHSVSSFKYWIENFDISYTVIKFEDLIKTPNDSIEKLFYKLESSVPSAAFKPLEKNPDLLLKRPNQLELESSMNYMKNQIWNIVGDTAKYFNYQNKVPFVDIAVQ